MRHQELPPVIFSFRSAELSTQARAIVSGWATALDTSSGIFRVLGWCDPRGEHPGARPLAKARAEAVLAALVALGVPSARLRTGVRPSLADGSRATLEPCADEEEASTS